MMPAYQKADNIMSKAPFILASSSPRRQQLIASLGIEFQIIKPQIDETQQPDESPMQYVMRLSREKGAAVAQRLENDAMILAADTVVILAADTIGIDEMGEILGKPTDAEDARQILRRLRNRAHQVVTSFTLLRTGDNPLEITRTTSTTVYMRDYTDAEIEAYIVTGDPFDKAGSYAIQHETFAPVERIEGSRNNVIGLPIEDVKSALIEMGYLDA